MYVCIPGICIHAGYSNLECPDELATEKVSARAEVSRMKREQSVQDANSLKQSLPPTLQRFVELAKEKGASIWLTSRPIQKFGFASHGSVFQDALALCYNWQLLRAPSTCACGSKFSVEHAPSCPKNGFPSIRHNEIRDLS